MPDFLKNVLYLMTKVTSVSAPENKGVFAYVL